MRQPMLALVPLLLAACAPGYAVETAATLPVNPHQVPPDVSAICVLRPGTFGWAAAVRHYDNGHLVGLTRGGRQYFCYPVQPGWHRLVARTDDDTALAVEARPGAASFVVLRIQLGPEHLALADPAWGLRQLRDLRPVVARPTGPGSPAPMTAVVPAQATPGSR